MNGKAVKVIGVAVTVVGAGLSLVSDWVNNKQMDDKIAEKVSKAIAESKK